MEGCNVTVQSTMKNEEFISDISSNSSNNYLIL